MKQRGFLEEAALGVAEAVASDRGFAAAVLIGSVLFLRDARWDVGALFLAGAAVSRGSLKTRWLVFLLMAGVARGLDSEFPVREWSDVDLAAPFVRVSRYHHVAACLVAGAAGMRSIGLALLGAALGAVASYVRREPVVVWWPISWEAASLGLVALGVARRSRTGIAVAAAALFAAGVWNTAELRGSFPSAQTLLSRAPGVATEAAFVFWPLIAGLAAAAIRAPLERADPVRLLALLQRSPWLGVSGVASFAILYGGPSLSLGAPSRWHAGGLLALALVNLGSSLLVAVNVGGSSILGSLAVPLWLSAPLIAAWNPQRSTASALPLVAQIAVAAFLPLLLFRGSRGTAPRWVSSRGLSCLIVLMLAQAVLRSGCDWEFLPFGWGSTWLWLLLASVAFQSATHATASPRRIVAVAAALGVAWWLALLAGGGSVDRSQCAEAVGVWFLGGVYVVMARRASSLTAVPLDHPSIAEAPPAATTIAQGA